MKNLNKNIFRDLKIKTILIMTVFCFLFVSCGTTTKYYKADFEKLNHKIDGEYFNCQTTILGEKSSQKITDLLGLKTNDSIIKLKTIGNNLIVSFNDENGIKKNYGYPGDFTSKQFKLYLNYETTTIPILFVQKSMQCMKFSVLKDKSLVINYESVNEGMLLIIGAGNSYTSELVYKSKN